MLKQVLIVYFTIYDVYDLRSQT